MSPSWRVARVSLRFADGLRIEGDRCENHIQAVQATADIAGMGVVDYVLLCVKLWDDESAGEEICPIVGPQTSVVPLQNGVDAADRLIPILGCEAVMSGMVGRMFQEFAVTVTVAIAVSALVSLTLTPMMGARLLRHETPGEQGRLSRGLEWCFDALLADL